MSVSYVIILAVTVIALLFVSIPDYIPARSVLKTSSQVGVPRSWLPWLGTAKLFGAIGLLLGLAQVVISSAVWASAANTVAAIASACLVLFFIGAVAFHVRSRVFYNIYFPAGYLALSIASLMVTLNAAGS